MTQKTDNINRLVANLTDNATFFTFFRRYLSAENSAERQEIENYFWAKADKLSPDKQHFFRAELTRCFLKLLSLASQLLDKASMMT
ncbi:hypothetical protein [Runella sp.]|uniref:hypothetical protein n=1 Tax=Runella sp. TaxID=1960881 RepID=UPI00260A723B|nr:hypothetical protein [Runella sp.]